jgi:hypothetical protein
MMTGMIPFHALLFAASALFFLPAAAAAQDKTVFGIELGKPFLIPACSGSGTFTDKLCFNPALVTRKPWGADEYQVSLPRAGVPPYVRGELKVITVKGIVEAVQTGTWGFQAQSGALAALTKQYGPPARARQQKQSERSRFATQYAEWDLKDFSVKLDGTTGSIDWGLIDVSTHRYRQLVQDHEKRAAKATSG